MANPIFLRFFSTTSGQRFVDSQALLVDFTETSSDYNSTTVPLMMLLSNKYEFVYIVPICQSFAYWALTQLQLNGFYLRKYKLHGAKAKN